MRRKELWAFVASLCLLGVGAGMGFSSWNINVSFNGEANFGASAETGVKSGMLVENISSFTVSSISYCKYGFVSNDTAGLTSSSNIVSIQLDASKNDMFDLTDTEASHSFSISFGLYDSDGNHSSVAISSISATYGTNSGSSKPSASANTNISGSVSNGIGTITFNTASLSSTKKCLAILATISWTISSPSSFETDVYTPLKNGALKPIYTLSYLGVAS